MLDDRPPRLRARWRTLIAVGLAVLALDQWTKLLAVAHLTPGIAAEHVAGPPGPISAEAQEDALEALGPLAMLRDFYGRVESPCDARGARCPSVRVIDGFWSWRYAENKGAAWSMFSKLPDGIRIPLLVGVASAALVGIVFFLRTLEEDQRTLIFALSLISGGAAGNLIDRARLGYVVDFIEWHYGSFRWPTFNVADSAISTGVALIVLSSLVDLIGKRRRERGTPADGNRPLASPIE